jgi:hypothetical protein
MLLYTPCAARGVGFAKCTERTIIVFVGQLLLVSSLKELPGVVFNSRSQLVRVLSNYIYKLSTLEVLNEIYLQVIQNHNIRNKIQHVLLSATEWHSDEVG